MLPFFELDGPSITDSSSKPADTQNALLKYQKGPNQKGPNQKGPNQKGPNQKGPNQKGPNQKGSDQTGSDQTGSDDPDSGDAESGSTGLAVMRSSVTGRLSAAQVLLLGKLVSMPHREAKQIIRQQGGMVVAGQAVEAHAQDTADAHGTVDAHGTDGGGSSKQASERHLDQEGREDQTLVTMVVVGDDVSAWRLLLQQQYPTVAQGVDSGQIELLQESEFLRRVGLMDPLDNVRRLYTPAMLAELLSVSVSAIRHWVRQGTLVACRQVRRLPYFDFTEVSIARHLADLHIAGCSLRVIDRKLRELAVMMPCSERPLAETGVVVEGRRLYIRRGDDLEDPCGQRQFDFDRLVDEKKVAGVWKESIPLDPVGSVAVGADGVGSDAPGSPGGGGFSVVEDGLLATESSLTMFDRLLQEAARHEEQGSLELAVETYRAILMAGGPSAEINFALADVLYRQGEYIAARERYYMAIEMDEEYVEARANLGCVLAEMDELEMAIAAFQGALAYHVDYADVHYHMAGALDRMQRHQEAQVHWRTFLALAPESAWAEVARLQLSDK